MLNFAHICQVIERDRVRAKAVIRSPRSDRLMTLHGEVLKIRPAVLEPLLCPRLGAHYYGG